MLTQILFYLFSSITIFSAVMVLLSKKPVHSVLFLTLTFFSIAGHFILLNAQFIAIVNVIVYAGAIMVLFLFTVMLLNLNVANEIPKKWYMILGAILAGGMLFLTITAAVKDMDLVLKPDAVNTQIGLVKNLGKILFSEFRVPFEISSILFLASMVGAVMFGKKTGD